MDIPGAAVFLFVYFVFAHPQRLYSQWILRPSPTDGGTTKTQTQTHTVIYSAMGSLKLSTNADFITLVFRGTLTNESVRGPCLGSIP